ncbi:acetate and butyrate kinase [Desarmillaria tabescens]|uniref:Probable acetate kinase n=1 Tax=Armillaria tabescens TaxID=1929756 RepID=A0AA39NQ85_ARMTA|nr:acetate and butyrate kinase [Desarmillaria tabescens]KAK0469816.1 acetate and butyrate kinase [Desarmillaria tabescens]
MSDITPASRTGLILSANAGSSSLKISLYELVGDNSESPKLLLTSSISNITAPPVKFSFAPSEVSSTPQIKNEEVPAITEHASAFAHFLDSLECKANIDKNRIVQVCHRVVHGGDFTDPVVISDETYQHIEKLSDLAPLHNGAALAVIKACIAVLPNANSIAFFDTAFHRSIPPHIAGYAIDQTVAKKRGLKKYGFHGLSCAERFPFPLPYHRSHSRRCVHTARCCAISQQGTHPPSALNLIILHLGSGASVCAVKEGCSYDTSMGLTPLNGLPGATRSGAIDPSLIFHYTNKAGRISHDPKVATQLHVTQAEHILNSKSGWKSLTGTTDFGLITRRAKEGSAVDQLAFNLFKDRVLNYIGSYHLKLEGQVDALVFSGGIGERSVELRSAIGAKLECLGYSGVGDANEDADHKEGVVIDVSRGNPETKKILICRTDEQFEMARQCAQSDKFWERV